MADISKIKLIDGTVYDIKDSIRYDKIISRGEQLIVNGTALLGNNTNFSSWSFDGSMANGSAGSFTKPAGNASTTITDEYFPVTPSLQYRLDIDLISKLGVGKMYTFPAFYDVDKRSVEAYHHMYRPNTLTALARELKNGDTVVYLTDLTNWDVNTATRTYQRGFIFWNYTNSFGYTYPENTYSRNTYSNLYTDANVNKTNNTITLTSAWNKGTFPSGTKVSQCDSGGNYKYIATSNTTIPTTWTTYTGMIGGVDYSGRNVDGKFPPGVAYAKIGFLWNYQGSGNNEQIWTTNVSFKESYLGCGGIANLGNATPAANVKELYLDSGKLQVGFPKVYYNQTGTEYTILFSKGSANGNYGSILKWGYGDRYIRILRRGSGNWSTTDWEKTDAGYADSAGYASELSVSLVDGADAVNAFKGSRFKQGYVRNYSAAGLASNDGMIMWIPYNANYGQQLLFDDTVRLIKTRCYNNGTWGDWSVNLADINAQINSLSTGSSTPVDADYYISQYVNGGTTTTTYHRRPMSALWEYVKGKISSVLGLTDINYGGTSAKATADASGNTITSTYLTKASGVTNVAWDSTNKKLTKTINGSTSDVATAATLRTGLNVADGAEVNQNAFSNVKVGSTTVAADSKTDTLELVAGSNVTLTPDATNDKVTIAATDTTYESKAAASGGTAVSLVTTGEKYTWNNKSTVPTNHAATATTYGAGSLGNYGHVKLSASTSSTSGTSGGIAATPSAVKTAYDLADTANGTANSALSGVNGNLIYDHTFTISNGVATFTPHVYQKGSEVTTNYAKSCFTWKYRLIDGSEVTLTTKNDRGCDVTITNLGYGGHVIGIFIPA